MLITLAYMVLAASAMGLLAGVFHLSMNWHLGRGQVFRAHGDASDSPIVQF